MWIPSPEFLHALQRVVQTAYLLPLLPELPDDELEP
jgi:hypothetical protein